MFSERSYAPLFSRQRSKARNSRVSQRLVVKFAQLECSCRRQRSQLGAKSLMNRGMMSELYSRPLRPGSIEAPLTRPSARSTSAGIPGRTAHQDTAHSKIPKVEAPHRHGPRGKPRKSGQRSRNETKLAPGEADYSCTPLLTINRTADPACASVPQTSLSKILPSHATSTWDQQAELVALTVTHHFPTGGIHSVPHCGSSTPEAGSCLTAWSLLHDKGAVHTVAREQHRHRTREEPLSCGGETAHRAKACRNPGALLSSHKRTAILQPTSRSVQ